MVNRTKVQKQRLDIILVEKGLSLTRNRAQSEIMAGNVQVNGICVDKPGTLVKINAQVELLKPKNPYVSRGGLKLEFAIKEFNLNLKDKIVIDVGSSTGGFTDCALQHGAKRIYSVDVGFGQLDWMLRKDPRVIIMERKNIRFMTKNQIPEVPDIALIDVSFISLKLVLPVIKNLGVNETLTLIKPQFEAGREKVGKKGLVRNPDIHYEVLYKITSFARREGYYLKKLTHSPIKGAKGNIEFLAYFSSTFNKGDLEEYSNLLRDIIEKAHHVLT